MKKTCFLRRLVEETKMEPAAAADHLDRLVHKLVRQVKQGKPPKLPGLGAVRMDHSKKR